MFRSPTRRVSGCRFVYRLDFSALVPDENSPWLLENLLFPSTPAPTRLPWVLTATELGRPLPSSYMRSFFLRYFRRQMQAPTQIPTMPTNTMMIMTTHLMCISNLRTTVLEGIQNQAHNLALTSSLHHHFGPPNCSRHLWLKMLMTRL